MKYFVVSMILVIASAGRAELLTQGAEHLSYTVGASESPANPNKVHVVRIDRTQRDLSFHLGFANKKRNYNPAQAVSTIVAGYENGAAFDVLAATNGAYFSSGSTLINGPLISESNLVSLPLNTGDTMMITDSMNCMVQRNMQTTGGIVLFSDGTSMDIDVLNNTRDASADVLACYSPYWQASTGSTVQGVEVVLGNLNYPLRPQKQVWGTVTAVHTGLASLNNSIPAGGMVLSARDAKAAQLLSKVSVGAGVGVKFWMNSSAGATINEFNNASMCIMGFGWLLSGGVPQTGTWSQYTTDLVTGRHPRTVLGYNASHIFLLTVDGRQSGVSVGMTFEELANYLLTLGITEAVNLDGGGSTTMWVDGSVVNVPSGPPALGSERPVANAVMLVKRPAVSTGSLSDSFPPTGRQLAWDEKFGFSPVVSFSPIPAGGDGSVLHVRNALSTFETLHVGKPQDSNYAIEADVYFNYKPGDPGEERTGLFARDNGNFAFNSTGYGGGNCYFMSWESDTGRLRCGKSAGGTATDMLPIVTRIQASGWHRLKIQCMLNSINYYLDNTLKLTIQDTTFSAGQAGIAYSETFPNNALTSGGRVDNFSFTPLPVTAANDWQLLD